MKTERVVTYKVVKNEYYGDYRLEQYINGKWENGFDGNWTKEYAESRLKGLEKPDGSYIEI